MQTEADRDRPRQTVAALQVRGFWFYHLWLVAHGEENIPDRRCVNVVSARALCTREGPDSFTIEGTRHGTVRPSSTWQFCLLFYYPIVPVVRLGNVW